MKYLAPRGMSDASDVLDAISKGVDTAQEGYDFARDVENRFSTTNAPADTTDMASTDQLTYDTPATDGAGASNFTVTTNDTPPPAAKTDYTPWLIGGGVLVGGALLIWMLSK